MEFPGAVPNIKDYQVSMDGDIVRGQFLTQIAGKDVYLTLAGHLGSKDGYATFDATEVKVGDLSVPVSLVNEVLQKKLAEQRDQLKLPNNVKDLKVENGELVFVEKPWPDFTVEDLARRSRNSRVGNAPAAPCRRNWRAEGAGNEKGECTWRKCPVLLI